MKIDDIKPAAPPRKPPQQALPQPETRQPPQPEPTPVTPQSPQRETAKGGRGRTAIVLIAAVGIGLLIQFQFVGQLLILIYAAASVIWRIPSRTTFTLALLSLGATLAALLFGKLLIAENFAAYSFLLLAVGTLGLCIEQWRLSKSLRIKHHKTPYQTY